ncbi:hypothetical protein ACOME3_004786 [Neoechinorhynchus agilis]
MDEENTLTSISTSNPRDSYINALDFNSTKDLVQYLQSVSSNKTRYERFHYFRTNLTRVQLGMKSTAELVSLLIDRIGAEQKMVSEFVSKALDESPFCAFGRYIQTIEPQKFSPKIWETEKSECLPHEFLSDRM